MGSNENPAPHHETPTLGNPDLPQEGMVNTAGDSASTTMTGPRNPVLESQFPNLITAPGTDIAPSRSSGPRSTSRPGASSAAAGPARSRRPISRSPTRSPGEHVPRDGWHPGAAWHQTAEWALMTEGKCRVTTLSPDGCTSRMSSPETSGSSRPGCRTRCRGSARTARSSCSRSTTAPSPRGGRCRMGLTTPVIFRLSQSKPVYGNSGGSIRIADS